MCVVLCAELALKQAAQPIYPDSPENWPKMINAVDAAMRDLLVQFQNGLDPNAFFFKFDQILFDGHIDAHLLGQDQAGGVPSRGFARAFAREVTDGETEYLRGFVQDLMSGRYVKDGSFQIDRVMTRARLYQGKMRGTVGKGFTDGSKSTDEFVWTLGGTEDHCLDCPQLAAISQANPFTPGTIFQHPGDGETPCLGNCKCYLVRVRDGAMSQRP